MRRRAKILLFVSALVAAALSGLPPATSAPTGPVGSRVPSIVEQMVSQIDARSRSRSSTPVSALSNAVVHVDDGGRIELALHAGQPTGPAEESDLAKLGATGIRTLPASPFTPKVGLVEAFVPAAQVGAAAALPWVKAVTTPSYGNVDVGSVNSEGVAFHLADVAQTAGFDGTGFDIGVISDGVTNLAASQALGDLPNTVNVLDAGQRRRGHRHAGDRPGHGPWRRPPVRRDEQHRGHPRGRPQQPRHQRGRDHHRGHPLRRRARLPGRPGRPDGREHRRRGRVGALLGRQPRQPATRPGSWPPAPGSGPTTPPTPSPAAPTPPTTWSTSTPARAPPSTSPSSRPGRTRPPPTTRSPPPCSGASPAPSSPPWARAGSPTSTSTS